MDELGYNLKKIRENISPDWKEFLDTGLVQYINQILYVFGWELRINFKNIKDEDIEKLNNDVVLYPLRTKNRSTPKYSKTINLYEKISKYLKNNIDTLLKEATEDYERVKRDNDKDFSRLMKEMDELAIEDAKISHNFKCGDNVKIISEDSFGEYIWKFFEKDKTYKINTVSKCYIDLISPISNSTFIFRPKNLKLIEKKI